MRAVYMADWMANAICEADMKPDDEIKGVRDYIFSFAKEMGYEDYVDYDGRLGKYYATFDLDDESSTRKLIERYDEHSAWEELTEWLGDRDFFHTYTREEIVKMNNEERFTKRMECEAVWGKEFEKHGLERIKIAETPLPNPISKSRKIKGKDYE